MLIVDLPSGTLFRPNELAFAETSPSFVTTVIPPQNIAAPIAIDANCAMAALGGPKTSSACSSDLWWIKVRKLCGAW